MSLHVSKSELVSALPLIAILMFSGALFTCGCGSGAPASNGGGGTPSPIPTPTPAAINEWTWMGGSSSANAAGTYGSMGVASTNNIPPAREGSATWTDSSGHFWLYGGAGDSSAGTFGLFGDLWEFNPTANTWMWVNGSNALDSPAVFGTQGSPSTLNTPGARWDSTSWIDSSGNLWLFGGYVSDSSIVSGPMNDLWEFNSSTKEWTWVSGSNVPSAGGIYGTQGISAANNVPGARAQAVSWIDKSGDFWLFGGSGYDSNGAGGSLNDLWEFNPASKQWTWVSGSTNTDTPGVYGTKGVASVANVPGSRIGSAGWIDTGGNLWLFGGSDLNDLWEFSPTGKTWTWMSGNNTPGTQQAGVYGIQGVAASTNVPASRSYARSWTDSGGNLWLFGGQGYDSTGFVNVGLNDLWKWNPLAEQWTWVSGSSSVPSGNYWAPGTNGTLGVASSANVPLGRFSAMGWVDTSGNLWLFGGVNTAPNPKGVTNWLYQDLWRYQQ